MDRKTLEALQGSIKKWEEIVKRTRVDMGGKNCHLCELYADSCTECPICELTGYAGCGGSPYREWVGHHSDEHNCLSDDFYTDLYIECETCKKLAEKELAFLKSLLPRNCNE